ncbi:MAG TPA: hydroxyacid dehydrogenase [Solirubrobacterales bacterium]|nr:hydroxyacid dehydrogenase [Solirubrobacterales bacterium]
MGPPATAALSEERPGAAADGRAARVLIVDPLHAEAIAALRERHEVEVRLGPSAAELAELIGDVDVLVLRSGVRVPAELIERAPRLRLIARAGVGVDNIDVAAARRAGIHVFNVPAQSAGSVAELAFGLLLAVARRIPLAAAGVRRDEWRKAELVGQELAGGTLGIVGLGAIGSLIARRALAFEMRVVAAVAAPSEERRRILAAEGVELLGLDAVLARADALCVVVPLTGRTRNLIDARALARLRPGAFLVNVSRGGVVDEDALRAALRDGHLAGAALDVVVTEGRPTPLAALDNVVVTPHIGAMTEGAQRRIGEIVVASIELDLAGGRVATRVC